MEFPAAVRSVLSQYVTFSGRARRSEYWWFYLFTVLVSIGAAIIDGLIDAASGHSWNVVGLLAWLALLLPSLAVGVRRLHDTGRTGWWILLPLAPAVAALMCFVGFIVSELGDALDGTVNDSSQGFAGLLIVLMLGFALLALAAGVTLVVFFCLDSNAGPNKYGPSPKYPTPPMVPGGYPPAPYGQPYPYSPPQV